MRRSPPWRIRGIFLPCLVAALLFGGCGATTGSPAAKQILRQVPREERIALVVLNFRNATLKEKAAEYEPWGFGIPSMIMTDLESIGLFNIQSWDALKDVLEQQAFQSMGVVDEREAVKIGRIAAARYLLSGSFMVLNGSLRIESKVFSVEEGTLLGAASVVGSVDRFYELEKELMLEMTNHLGALLTPEETARLAANIETRSVDASLANYAGEDALVRAKEFRRKGKPEQAETLLREAKERFRTALRQDPGYARARRNLATLTLAIPMTL